VTWADLAKRVVPQASKQGRKEGALPEFLGLGLGLTGGDPVQARLS
jgi:hypothetical protein